MAKSQRHLNRTLIIKKLKVILKKHHIGDLKLGRIVRLLPKELQVNRLTIKSYLLDMNCQFEKQRAEAIEKAIRESHAEQLKIPSLNPLPDITKRLPFTMKTNTVRSYLEDFGLWPLPDIDDITKDQIRDILAEDAEIPTTAIVRRLKNHGIGRSRPKVSALRAEVEREGSTNDG